MERILAYIQRRLREAELIRERERRAKQPPMQAVRKWAREKGVLA